MNTEQNNDISAENNAVDSSTLLLTEETPENENKEIETWEELDAKMPLLRGVYSYGFEKPSPIQRKAIKPMFDKKDLIAQAQSGTGKTACFSIGALELIDSTNNVPQAMILSSTNCLVVICSGNQ